MGRIRVECMSGRAHFGKGLLMRSFFSLNKLDFIISILDLAYPAEDRILSADNRIF